MKSFMVLRNCLLILCVALAACQSAAQEPVEFDTAAIEVAGKSLPVEFANTPEQRARGLMYRQSLCEDCGMLFRFVPVRQASMWMKNTFIPLTVLFIDERGYVLEMKDMIPNTETPHCSTNKVRFALELETKWLKSTNIKSKSRITNLNSVEN